MNNLDMVTTDELVAELQKRHDGCIIARGRHKTDDDYTSVVDYAGTDEERDYLLLRIISVVCEMYDIDPEEMCSNLPEAVEMLRKSNTDVNDVGDIL